MPRLKYPDVPHEKRAPAQSSAVVMCRAMVMLVCLVALPLAAIFGTSLPDLVNSGLQYRWGFRLTAVDPEPVQSLPVEMAPFFQPDSRVESVPSLPTTANAAAGTIRASYQTPVGQPPIGQEPSMPRFTDPGHISQVPPQPDRSVVAVPLGTETPTAREATQPVQPLYSDQFAYIQSRLRELGATYYLLETWGERGDSFRFQCRMAVGQLGEYTQYFEATDDDALAAMNRVLDEVEAWQAVN